MLDNKQRQKVASLYRQHAAIVRARLKGLGFYGATLEDLHQDVFAIATTRAADVPVDARAWLIETTRKVAANYRRRHRHRFEIADDETAMAMPAVPELPELLRQELEALSDMDWELVVRHYANGESVIALGHDLGLATSTVYTRLRAARERLRRSILEGSPETPHEEEVDGG